MSPSFLASCPHGFPTKEAPALNKPGELTKKGILLLLIFYMIASMSYLPINVIKCVPTRTCPSIQGHTCITLKVIWILVAKT